MSTSKVSVTEGAGKNLATHQNTEDALAKDWQRVVLNQSDGSEVDLVGKLGSLTEAAPVSDTASSGINGRLQRIAQRVSSLIGLFPTTIGQKAKAASLAVTLASDEDALAILGTTTGAAVITDANGTLQQYARGVIKQWIAGTLTLASTAYSASVTLTRTADTNPYIVGDVLGTATGSTAALTFTNMGPSGGIVVLTSATLEIDKASVPATMTSFRGYLYNATPPSAFGDNAPWTGVTAADRASYLGYIDFGTPAALGTSPATLFVQADNINKQIKLAGTSLFMYLVTNGGYTPASADVHVVTLHTQAP